MPQVKPPRLRISPEAAEARRLRLQALAKAQRTVNELLDHSSAGIRLEAARDVLDRAEGKAVATVQHVQHDPEQTRLKAEVESYLDHVQAVCPSRFGDVMEWMRALSAGETVPTAPADLPEPPGGLALDLHRRMLAASVQVKVLQ